MRDSPLPGVVCCIGENLAGNPTQFIMERAFAAAGFDWRYLTLEVPQDKLVDAVKGIGALGFRGANILDPHKKFVGSWLEETSDLARRSGVVTCLINQGSRLFGENTDGTGFIAYLREFSDPAGKRVLLLGAGLLATSIALALAQSGVQELVVVNRHEPAAIALSEKVNQWVADVAHVQPWTPPIEVPENVDLVVNATSVGQGDEGSPPVATRSLRPDLIVADGVWYPWRTRWLRTAQEHGCTVMDGLGLFIHSLAQSFQYWTGHAADLRHMRDAAEEYLDI